MKKYEKSENKKIKKKIQSPFANCKEKNPNLENEQFHYEPTISQLIYIHFHNHCITRMFFNNNLTVTMVFFHWKTLFFTPHNKNGGLICCLMVNFSTTFTTNSRRINRFEVNRNFHLLKNGNFFDFILEWWNIHE